jgi:putative CocE/NonD family hydrolase
VVPLRLFLAANKQLLRSPPVEKGTDAYLYDPADPTPTLGGSIVSYVIQPGSVDVSAAQARDDVVSYTSAALESDIDIVGPIRAVLFASSSARDTDFVVRLSYVDLDGRAIQLQNGVLRARYRRGGPVPLEPGVIERFEIDLWATAYRFRAGQRMRVDISSADFPRFERNTNLGGLPGAPQPAWQRIFHGGECASHVVLYYLPELG